MNRLRLSKLRLDAMNRLAMIAAVLAAAAAAVLLNVLLLNSATSSNDPIGKLTPNARLPAPGTSLRPAPPGVVQPASGPIEGEARDD